MPRGRVSPFTHYRANGYTYSKGAIVVSLVRRDDAPGQLPPVRSIRISA